MADDINVTVSSVDVISTTVTGIDLIAGSDTTAIHDNAANEISAVTDKASPHNDDMVIIEDSQALNVKKSVKFSNFPGSPGANTGLSNLTTVAINTTLLSDTDNTDALGTTTVSWSDLFLGNESVITWSTAPSTIDMTLTHAANILTFAGGTVALGTATATGGLTGNVTGDASGSSGSCTGNSATVTNGVYTTDFPLNQDTTGKADTAGNADTVTNATLTSAVTVNTGTLTLTAHVDNDSVLTIGKGASSVSGANTGDQTSSDFTHNSLTGLNDGTTYEHLSATEKTNAATGYSHSQVSSGNPHSVSSSDVGLGNVPNTDCTNATNITTGTLSSAVLPPVALTTVAVYATEVAMLAATTEEGDVGVRSDLNKSYMHNDGSAGTMGDWTELQTPTDTVLSVNTKTGTVVINPDDLDDTATTNKFVTSTDITNLGNLSGNNSGDNTVCTSGDATTAETLKTARTIASVSFDGSANIALNNNAITNGEGYTTNTGDTILASVQSVTGLKTFDTTKLAVKGSSTGTTAVASANASATDYTATLQAATGTVAYTADITGTNSGTNTGDNTVCTSGTATTVDNATLTTALTVNTGTLTLTAHADNDSVLTIGKGAASVSGANTGDNTVCTSGTATSAGTVTNATFTTALIVDTGDLTLTAHVDDDSVLTIGKGAVSVSGANTGDNTVCTSGTATTVDNATLTTALTVNTGTLTLTAHVDNDSVLTIGKGAASVSGANTGDNTVCTSGTATTAATLATARDIGGTSFNGSASITVATATGGFTVSGGNLALTTNDAVLTGAIGRDTDNEINWGTDDSLAIVIAGTTHNIVSISDGAGDNDKLATQGYVDDSAAAGGATAALDNLASVAVNETLVSDTDNTDALGTTAIAWSDLFLGNGSVVTWNSAPSTADLTLTHSAEVLTFAGGTVALGTATATGGLTGNVTGDASGSSGSCTGESATVANATLTTALTVNTGTLTLTADAGNDSVLTIGGGAVDVSGSNTGDNTVCTSGTATSAGIVTNATFTTALVVNGGDLTLTANVADDSVLTIASGASSISGANTGDNTVCTSGTATTVDNATFTTALTVDTGTLTLTAHVDNDSILTIGKGASSISGANTGDQDLSGKANVDQTMYIGTTGVAINRGTAALTLAGITLTTPDIGTPSAGILTNCSGTAANLNIGGVAATATALATARTIGGVSFDGSAAIVPTTIAVTDTADATCYVGLWESATGDLLPQTDAGLTYAADTGILTVTASVDIGGGTDVSPSSLGVGHVVLNADGYNGYITADGTGTYLGNNSSSRTLELQTDETTRFSISGTGTCNVVGTLTSAIMVTGNHGTAATDQVVNVCYGTSATPPTASTTTEGTIYVQYTA